MPITLIMVLIRTGSTWYTTNVPFGETTNKFQVCNIKKICIRNFEGKTLKRNFKITRIPFYLIKPV